MCVVTFTDYCVPREVDIDTFFTIVSPRSRIVPDGHRGDALSHIIDLSPQERDTFCSLTNTENLSTGSLVMSYRTLFVFIVSVEVTWGDVRFGWNIPVSNVSSMFNLQCLSVSNVSSVNRLCRRNPITTGCLVRRYYRYKTKIWSLHPRCSVYNDNSSTLRHLRLALDLKFKMN